MLKDVLKAVLRVLAGTIFVLALAATVGIPSGKRGPAAAEPGGEPRGLDLQGLAQDPELEAPPARAVSRRPAIAAAVVVTLLGSGWALWRRGILRLPYPLVEAAEPGVVLRRVPEPPLSPHKPRRISATASLPSSTACPATSLAPLTRWSYWRFRAIAR